MSNVFIRATQTLVLGLLIFALPNRASFAQPFGIAEGTPTAELNVVREHHTFFYVITPKAPHPDFESYTATSTPEDGVCRLAGIGFTLGNDAYGTQSRSLFEKIADQLSGKYGKSKTFDFLHAGSIWHEPREWAMAVYKNERSFARVWSKKEGSTLQNGIESILLSIYAVASDKTYVSLSFDYDNHAKCDAKMKAIGAGAL